MNRKMYFLEAQKGTVKDLEDFTLLEDASYTAKKLISNQLDKVKIYESIIDDNENIIDKKCIFDYDSLREVPVSINTIDISIDEPEEINNDMDDKFEVSLTDLHNQENQPVEVTDLDNLLAGSFVESRKSYGSKSSTKLTESYDNDYDFSDYMLYIDSDGEAELKANDQYIIDADFEELSQMSDEELESHNIMAYAYLIKDDEENLLVQDSYSVEGYEDILKQAINKYTKGLTEGKEETLKFIETIEEYADEHDLDLDNLTEHNDIIPEAGDYYRAAVEDLISLGKEWEGYFGKISHTVLDDIKEMVKEKLGIGEILKKLKDNASKYLTESSTNDSLKYDRDAAKKFKNDFDVASPQETANAFGKSVVYKNKKYVPNIKEDADPSNVDFIFSGKDKKYPYQMLSRLKSDCDYYLGAGNRANKHLWALNPKDQIAYMKAIYDRLEEKPDWLTLDQINDYEKQMLSEKYSIKEDVNNMTIEDKLNYLNEYPTYRADGFGKVYSRPCKVWDLGLTDEQEEKFFTWIEEDQLSNFWMVNDELSQDIYQSGRMGGHLILDPEVLDPKDFIDVTSYNELVDEYLDSNYYPDNDDGTYTDRQKQEAKEEVDLLINDAYDKLVDFDNRVDQLIENLKMELYGYVTNGESDDITESKQLNETVLKLPESNETSIWEYFSPEASIKEGLDALEIIKNYLGDIEYIEVNDLYDLQQELSPKENEIMSI